MLTLLDTILGILQKLSVILAAMMGLIWFKLRYTKNDWHVHSRLKVRIDGEILKLHGVTYLKVVTTLENVGLTGHRIIHDDNTDTYVCIYYSESLPQADTALTIRWSDATYFEVFQKHTWLSPGEVVKEELLIAIPENEALALKLEVGVVTKGSLRPWKDEKILFKELVDTSRVVRSIPQSTEAAPS
ncbi:MAG TPA: hypothetical protein VGZ22_22535 [Isosphaeraceae bacterium]|nr:hypothetical protein [Isosphaeraceae bacterium]